MDDSKVSVSVRLDPELLRKLDARAKLDGATRTALIERLLTIELGPRFTRVSGRLSLCMRVLKDMAAEDPSQFCELSVRSLDGDE